MPHACQLVFLLPPAPRQAMTRPREKAVLSLAPIGRSVSPELPQRPPERCECAGTLLCPPAAVPARPGGRGRAAWVGSLHPPRPASRLCCACGDGRAGLAGPQGAKYRKGP